MYIGMRLQQRARNDRVFLVQRGIERRHATVIHVIWALPVRQQCHRTVNVTEVNAVEQRAC